MDTPLKIYNVTPSGVTLEIQGQQLPINELNDPISNLHRCKPIVVCPHCSNEVIIDEINCQIFRHGMCKTTGLQLAPHASKEECDKAVQEDTIYGCGKPFRIDFVGDKWIATQCKYI